MVILRKYCDYILKYVFIVYKISDKDDRKRNMQIWYKEDVELIFFQYQGKREYY